jgi:hypothetical protein
MKTLRGQSSFDQVQNEQTIVDHISSRNIAANCGGLSLALIAASEYSPAT